MVRSTDARGLEFDCGYSQARGARAFRHRGPWNRIRSEWRLKCSVLLGLAVGICLPYFTLQRLTLFEPRSPPRTFVDEAIAFDPSWVWFYYSLCLMVPLAPLLAVQRSDLVRYARGLALLCAPCFATFLLLPVAGPRPESPPDHALYAWLVTCDTPRNALPSLHAGLAVFSAFCGVRFLRNALTRMQCAVFGSLASGWTAVILYSTLATKQHWAIDLPPGILAGILAYGLAWRSARSARTSSAEPAVAANTERYWAGVAPK